MASFMVGWRDQCAKYRLVSAQRRVSNASGNVCKKKSIGLKFIVGKNAGLPRSFGNCCIQLAPHSPESAVHSISVPSARAGTVGVALPLAVGPRLSPLRPRPRPRIWPRPRRMLPVAGIVVCLAPVPVSPSLLSEPESLLSGSLELSVSFLRVWDWVDVLSARRAVSASKPTKSSPESESAYSSRKPAAPASLSSAITFGKRRRHVQKSQKTAEYLYWNL